jgi:hypothetical protein
MARVLRASRLEAQALQFPIRVKIDYFGSVGFVDCG